MFDTQSGGIVLYADSDSDWGMCLFLEWQWVKVGCLAQLVVRWVWCNEAGTRVCVGCKVACGK